jgi:hypothetical protein
MMSRIVITSLGLAALATGATSQAQTGPLADPIPLPIPQSAIQVQLKPIATGLVSPIFLAVAGERGDGGDRGDRGDRKFIVDQTGLILIFRDGAILPTPFLDIRSVISQLNPAFGTVRGLNPGYDERGLLGLAFHPDFADEESPGFRTLYTMHNVPFTRPADFPDAAASLNCQEVIAEWKVDARNPVVVNPASYREILRFDRPQFNHNGGTVAFGPDGLLYASIGDGGNKNDIGDGHPPVTGNAQDLTKILGKVIRINPLDPLITRSRDGLISANGKYRIPRDNLFVAMAGAVKEIYAYGFRNPYRMSFDMRDGRLVLADVGQDNIEEVDIVTRGGNYGWHIKEGTFLFDPTTGHVFTDPSPNPSLINPVLEYDHFEATAGKITRIAVVGGFVYRGSKIRMLEGKYVFADLNGFLFAGDLKTGRIEQLLTAGMFIKGFGQDTDGELYVTGSAKEGPSGTLGVVAKILPVNGGDGGDGDGRGDGGDGGDDN